MSGRRFTLMAFTAGGGWPSVQLAEGTAGVVERAALDMVEHGAERVEVWREGVKLRTVRAPRPRSGR